jgi:hypothetical protein
MQTFLLVTTVLLSLGAAVVTAQVLLSLFLRLLSKLR